MYLGLTESELRPGFDLRQNFDIDVLRTRFCPMAGVRFKNEFGSKLGMGDIEIVPRTSDMCFLDEITAYSKLSTALQSKQLLDPLAFFSLLKSAQVRLTPPHSLSF